MMAGDAPIASKRHTAILVLIYVGLGVAGRYADRSGAVETSPTPHQALQLYVGALLIEWASLYYVWKGTRQRIALVDLIGGRWQKPYDIVIDLAVAAGVWIAWLGIQSLFPFSHGASALLPRGPSEVAIWVVLAMSAGFCEDVVFRGYFQRQFQALTGGASIAVALQALVFGIGHFYEGTWAVVKIIFYGLLFGLLARWRRSLRPGMLAHVWSDLYGAVIFR